jgi:hypothetical protein
MSRFLFAWPRFDSSNKQFKPKRAQRLQAESQSSAMHFTFDHRHPTHDFLGTWGLAMAMCKASMFANNMFVELLFDD